MPFDRSANRRRSSSLNRDGTYRDNRHHAGNPNVVGFGVGPPPLMRSTSAQSGRYSRSSSTSVEKNTSNTTTRNHQNRGYNRNLSESFDHFSQSSPTLSLSSNSGSGQDFHHRHHHKQRYASKQQQAQLSNLDIYTSSSNGSGSQRGDKALKGCYFLHLKVARPMLDLFIQLHIRCKAISIMFLWYRHPQWHRQ
jgi:hypothetical protein